MKVSLIHSPDRNVLAGEMMSRLLKTKMTTTAMKFDTALRCCSLAKPRLTRARHDLRLIGPASSPQVTDRGHRGHLVVWGRPRSLLVERQLVTIRCWCLLATLDQTYELTQLLLTASFCIVNRTASISAQWYFRHCRPNSQQTFETKTMVYTTPAFVCGSLTSVLVHESRWVNCPTRVGNLEASTVCWTEATRRVQLLSRNQAAVDRVCHVTVKDLVLNQEDKPKRHRSAR